MPAHRVKCPYCEHTFDANKEEYVKVQNGRRYAHKSCYDNAIALQDKEQTDKIELENYIKQLFHYDKLPKRVNDQIKKYTSKEYNYSYSGILKTLKYFFEIKGHTTEKVNGGIGIIPFVYEDAKCYYYDIWLTQQENESRAAALPQLDMPVREIHIKPPERCPMKQTRRLFTFLDMEVEDN